MFLLAYASPSFAHDPYEITATVRLETNRTTVEFEMEFNAAMALAGVPRSRDPVDAAGLFQSKLPELRRQAGQFFAVGSAGQPLVATSTNVTLGVEDHVKIELKFPATRSGLHINAAGLKPLGEQGPFGVGLTVLDLVNMKVLGQSTLFVSNPVAEFAPAVPAVVPVAVDASEATNVIRPAIAPIPELPAKPAPGQPALVIAWLLVAFVLGAFLLLALLWLWQSRSGRRHG